MEPTESNLSVYSLSVDEVNIILGGLGKLPFEVSNGLIRKIQEQVIPQLNAQMQAQVEEDAAEAAVEETPIEYSEETVSE